MNGQSTSAQSQWNRLIAVPPCWLKSDYGKRFLTKENRQIFVANQEIGEAKGKRSCQGINRENQKGTLTTSLEVDFLSEGQRARTSSCDGGPRTKGSPVSFPRKRESTMQTYCVYILASSRRGTLCSGLTRDQKERRNIRIEKRIADGGIHVLTWDRVDSRFRGNDNH